MKSDIAETIIGVVISLAVLAGIVFMTITLTNVGERNRQKGIQMHETCVEAGFSGWRNNIGCIGGSGDN